MTTNKLLRDYCIQIQVLHAWMSARAIRLTIFWVWWKIFFSIFSMFDNLEKLKSELKESLFIKNVLIVNQKLDWEIKTSVHVLVVGKITEKNVLC